MDKRSVRFSVGSLASVISSLLCLSLLLDLAAAVLTGSALVRAALIIAAVCILALLALCHRVVIPGMMQYDMAVNTLLAMSPSSHENVRSENLPSLMLLIDHVFTDIRDRYQKVLSQNRNSLAVLQNQINPHFLYNTLDCIRGEALDAGLDDVANMVESLSAFFRYSISTSDMLVQLRDELRNIQIYYQIQRYRFRDRFRLEVECEDERALNCYLPKLTLQPLMENCILHGLERTESDGLISIHIDLTDKRLIITLTDNGCGISPNDLARLQDKLAATELPEASSPRSSHGIALRNINLQLKLLFGQNYGLSLSSQQGVGTEAEIQIPAVYQRSDLVKGDEQL